jgi:hypothetical protein
MTKHLFSVVALLCFAACSPPDNPKVGAVEQAFVDVTAAPYNAKGNALRYSDGAMATGSTTFTSSSATFTAGDVGKVIHVRDAAGGGSPNALRTTIATYVNSHTVTLAAANASGAAVSGALFIYGTDDGPAVQAAVTAVLNGPGSGEIRFPTPVGAYLMASTVNAIATGQLRFVGEGATLMIGLDDQYDSTILVNTSLIEITGFRFESDIPVIGSGASPMRVLSLGGFTVSVHDCSFVDTMARDGVVVLAGHNNAIHDINIFGGYVSGTDRGIINLAYGGVAERVLGVDGNVNGAAAWMAVNPDVAASYDAAGEHPFTFRNCSFDEAGGASHILVKPTNGFNASRVEIVNCDGLGSPGATGSPYLIYDTDDVFIDNSALVSRTITPMVALYNVGRTTIRRQKWATPGTAAGQSFGIIAADSNCGTVKVIDSDFSTLSSDAADTTVELDGKETKMFPASNLATGLLVKADTSNAGRYVAAGTADPSSSVLGVVVKGTSKASATMTVPAPGSIPSPQYLYFNTSWGGQSGKLTEWRGDGGAFLGLPWVAINFQTDTTATQVATRAASVIAGLTSAGVFDVTASSSGANLTVTATVEGINHNRPVSDDVAFTMPTIGGGNAHAEIGLLRGQVYRVKIDGASAIAVGDKLKLSAVTAGRAAKATTGAMVGVALSASTATADAFVDMLFSPGTI